IRKDCGENGSLPIMIALTANAMEGVRESFLANGFQDFITKPLEIRPMHEALLKWIPEEKRIAGKVWTEDESFDDDKHEEFQNILIEGIDTDEVAKHYSGSEEEYQELLRLYCLDGKRKLTHLRELWEYGDYKSYGIEVHGLKSASANVGAMKVSNSAREHENAVNRGDETYVDSHISELLMEYEEQLVHIREFLDKNCKTEDVKEKEQEIEQADLIRKIKDALDSLENFRAKDCAHKIEDIMQYRLNSDTENKLEEIQEQLKLYEDDAAEQMLRDLIKQIEMEG
ncbi:MAG: response regulator, partial [Lachnospiraceae bacterium]|nr:response regulator [Lachnospiraceae bacterium]